ncbi:MAG: AraC family transcriptional regulator [Parabacteroides sp.]|nr:AraC family transcriptional regulator [Parabacteroides sp.]MDY5639415.1 AraC family transcriptional regulator [Parabacteroides sp.]
MRIDKNKYEYELRSVLHTIELAASKNRTNDATRAFEQEVNIDTLAQKTGMSPSSLKQWFKYATGMSIGRYAALRRAQYALRALHLPTNKNAKQASQIIGLNEAPALYPLLHRFGIQDVRSHYYNPHEQPVQPLESHSVILPKQTILTRSFEGFYEITHTTDFEKAYWTTVESIVNKYPQTLSIEGYVGIAIDDYVHSDESSGHFMAGIRCAPLNDDTIEEIKLGQLQQVSIPEGSEYMVYRHQGSYQGLVDFYRKVFVDIFLKKNCTLNLFIPLFEQYSNSPSDTPEEELQTELWVPITRPVSL